MIISILSCTFSNSTKCEINCNRADTLKFQPYRLNVLFCNSHKNILFAFKKNRENSIAYEYENFNSDTIFSIDVNELLKNPYLNYSCVVDSVDFYIENDDSLLLNQLKYYESKSSYKIVKRSKKYYICKYPAYSITYENKADWFINKTHAIISLVESDKHKYLIRFEFNYSGSSNNMFDFNSSVSEIDSTLSFQIL